MVPSHILTHTMTQYLPIVDVSRLKLLVAVTLDDRVSVRSPA